MVKMGAFFKTRCRLVFACYNLHDPVSKSRFIII